MSFILTLVSKSKFWDGEKWVFFEADKAKVFHSYGKAAEMAHSNIFDHIVEEEKNTISISPRDYFVKEG